MLLSLVVHTYSLRYWFPATIMLGTAPVYLLVWGVWRLLSTALPARVYHTLDDRLYCIYQSMVLFFFEHYTGVEVVIYGDIPKNKENVVYLSNHQSTVDWIIADMLAIRQSALGHVRYVLKDGLKWLPLYGWYFSQHGGMYVKRSAKFNETAMKKKLLAQTGAPMYLVIFPEGTRYNPELKNVMADSQAFAAKEGLAVLKHTLTPRMKASHIAIETMKGHLDAVYDITVAYEGTLDTSGQRRNAPSMPGTVNVTMAAEAVASQALCDNEVVNVPDRGHIDVVTKSLIVKAEGIEVDKTYNWLLCPKGEVLTEEIDVHPPENVIDGSARASVSVLGDILGRALQNLDGLLQMPYGCGEQNMALLAPNIYILQYLKNTDQLTPAIKEKATNFLTSGYQRQLNYKHNDGAYSTFGSGTGNTWLTAFVLRSYVKAESFIYIDPKMIEQSKTWLADQQRESGCFLQSGTLFNNRMKGGVSDEVTLSAYITATFLEMKISVNDPLVNKSLSCLKESTSDLSNTYTTALLAYVFTLAGDMETRALLLQHLDIVAIKDGGFLHWSQTSAKTSASLSVEISSYVLLAKVSASPTVEDRGYASRIVRWLTGQQNYYGGFSSTQDTVVALQALALYATLVFSPTGSSTVTVQSPSGQLTFDVNPDNKLLYQEKVLHDVTGKYSLETKGTACASVQISLHYNIPTTTVASTLSVEVKPAAYCTSRPRLTLKLKSLYSGNETTTNMVILDIKVLSGFVPDPDSLNELKGALLVDRVEQEEDHVVVYIRELTKDIPFNRHLVLTQELPVQNLKPAVVKIYDYYQPSDQSETEYIYPCAAA